MAYYEIIRNPERIAQIRARLASGYRGRTKPLGQIVRYVMPSEEGPLPRIAEVMEKTKYMARFAGEFYWFKTRGGHLEELIPASAYFTIANRGLTDKLYGVRFARANLDRCLSAARQTYRQTRNVLPHTKQPSFLADREVYQLKLALGSWLYTTKSFLDALSTVLYVVYGPLSKPYRRFSEYVQDLRAESLKDVEMGTFAHDQLGWYNRVRDLRDYDTHLTAPTVSFYEVTAGELTALIQNRIDLVELTREGNAGLQSFLEYFDTLFSERLRQAAEGAA